MGTRSKTTVFDEDGKPLLSFYRQYDGHFESHGAELQDFLSEMVIVNGFGTGTPAKAANGMGCLAAQLVKHFKEGIGGIYITNHDEEQEFNYEIRLVNRISKSQSLHSGFTNRLSLSGTSGRETQVFALYSDEILGNKILRRVSFVYDKQGGEPAKWRTVDVTEETPRYICGIEDGAFKKFLRSKITGGKILPA